MKKVRLPYTKECVLGMCVVYVLTCCYILISFIFARNVCNNYVCCVDRMMSSIPFSMSAIVLYELVKRMSLKRDANIGGD